MLVHIFRPMGTNTYLIAILISYSRCIEIPQDWKIISPGSLINHRLECGIECVLHGEISRLSLSINRVQGNDPQGVTNLSSHNMLIDRCYLNYQWSQLIEYSYSIYLGMVTTRATRPTVSVTTRHELSAIRCPNLRECCNTDVQTLKLR